MRQEYLIYGSQLFIVIAAALAVAALLFHKRKRALHIMTGGIYLALLLLFVRKVWPSQGEFTVYDFMVAAENALDALVMSYSFDKLSEFTAEAMGKDYRAYAAALFVVAPVLTLSNVLALFQITVDRLRYVVLPGKKYILSKMNEESMALAESIRKNHPFAQIIFTGVANRDKKKNNNLLLDRAGEIGALCLKKDVTRLYFGLPLRKNLIFLISRHEPENVSDALALIEKYKNRRCKMDIYVYAASPESKLAIDGADKGDRCLNRRFAPYLKKHLPEIWKAGEAQNWKEFAKIVENAPLEGRFTVRCVDVTEQTIRNVLEKHYVPIHEQAKKNDQVVGITIIGFGNHGMTLLKNAAWIFQFYGYRLRFNIVDLDGKARTYLQQQAPELLTDAVAGEKVDARHDVCFLGQDKGVNCLCSDFDDLFTDETFWERLQATQLVLVSLGDDSKNIATAIHIRELFQRKQIEAAIRLDKKKDVKKLRKTFEDPDSACSPLIFAVVNDRRRAENLKAAAEGKENDQARCNYHVEPVGTLRDVYDAEELQVLKDLESAALKNHLIWGLKSALSPDNQMNAAERDEALLKDLVASTEQYVRYSYYRDSSVATTLHQRLLRDLQGELETLAKTEDMDLTELKKMTEKMRWNAYMRAQGFQTSTVRNDRVKLHPLLVPYDDLPDYEKNKDLIEF